MAMISRKPNSPILALAALLMCALWGAIYAAGSSIYSVSLIELLVSPDRYIGKQISVKGYLDASANIQLFVSKDHADMRDFRSSVLISDNDDLEIFESSCIGTYVEVTGTLVKISEMTIAINNVVSLEDAKRQEICWVP